MKYKKHFEDMFNMTCGKLIGSGSSRFVYEYNFNKDWVVKVENDDENRKFCNFSEYSFYENNKFNKKVSKWLAPCYRLSPDGRILIQHKCTPVVLDDLPKKVPEFLTDLQISNFGWYKDKKGNKRIVCVDYAFTIDKPVTKKKKVVWYNG